MRASWRAALALVAMIGLGGGVAFAVTAGARRTASSFDTLAAVTNARDLGVEAGIGEPEQILARTPPVDGVEDTGLIMGFSGVLGGDGARTEYTIIGRWDDPSGVNRPIVTAGRFPRAADEAMLNEPAAEALGLGLGDHLEMIVSDPSFSDFLPVRLEIVGLGFDPSEVLQDELGTGRVVIVSRSFIERHWARALWSQIQVDVAPGADAEAVAAAFAGGGLFVDEKLADERRLVQRSVRPLVTALRGLAVLAALATLVVGGQALIRIVRRSTMANQSLRTMGTTTGQLRSADVLSAATVAAGSAIVAVAVALLVSPLFPVGPARRTELLGGIDADLAVLGGGPVILVMALAALVALGSGNPGGHHRPPPRWVPTVLSSRPAAAAGLRLAAAHQGLVPGLAVAMAIVVACATFSGSLDRLIDDQSLVGMTWDVGARGGSGFASVDPGALRAAVRDESTFERVTGIGFYSGSVRDAAVPVVMVDPVKGSPWPPVVSGRAPAAADEVLIGRRTLDDLGLGIGDRITISFPMNFGPVDAASVKRVNQTYTVVGSAVTPAVGQPGQLTSKLGLGAVLPAAALGDLLPEAWWTNVLFDLRPGGRPDDAFDRFPEGLPFGFGAPTEWFTSAAPAEISQAAGARTAIWLGVGALGVAVVATVIHALLGSVRQRRRQYAVLRALGFTRRQIRATVLWQSGAVLAPALIVALPLGIAGGRWLWKAFAEGVGIVVAPAVPVLALGAAVVGTILLVELMALVPASVARRASGAQSLRVE